MNEVLRVSEREFRSGVLGEWMTRAQAAVTLSVSPQAVSQLMKRGKLGYCIVGRRRFPSRTSVQAYGLLTGRSDLNGGKNA